MPQAVVDPEELRQFAKHLKKFNTDLRDRFGWLNNELNALSATWRDQEHKKFCETFEEQLKMISRFLEHSETHVPYLVRKADQIDDYLHG